MYCLKNWLRQAWGVSQSSGNESRKRLSASAGSLGADPRTRPAREKLSAETPPGKSKERIELLSSEGVNDGQMRKAELKGRLSDGAGSRNHKELSVEASQGNGRERHGRQSAKTQDGMNQGGRLSEEALTRNSQKRKAEREGVLSLGVGCHSQESFCGDLRKRGPRKKSKI